MKLDQETVSKIENLIIKCLESKIHKINAFNRAFSIRNSATMHNDPQNGGWENIPEKKDILVIYNLDVTLVWHKNSATQNDKDEVENCIKQSITKDTTNHYIAVNVNHI